MVMIIVLSSKQCVWNDNPECDRLLGHTSDTAITVPQELESAAKEYCPYCDLVIEDGQLTDIIALPRPEPAPPEPPELTPIETLQRENKLLKEQVSALSEQNDFQEELIVELAGVVYA